MHCIADILITHITTQHHISNQNMVKAYEQFQLVKVLFGETCKSYSINSDQQQLKMCNERANLVPYFVHFPASVQSSNYIRDHLTVILQMNLFAEFWEQKQWLQNAVNPNVIESVRRCLSILDIHLVCDPCYPAQRWQLQVIHGEHHLNKHPIPLCHKEI